MDPHVLVMIDQDELLDLEDERIDLRSALGKRTNRNASREELRQLELRLRSSEKNIRDVRRKRRQLLTEAARMVHHICPELLLDMPEILDPFVCLTSSSDSSGSTIRRNTTNSRSLPQAWNALPKRTLEDYDDVRPWDGQTPSRHVLLRATYDDDDVVLKVGETLPTL